MNSLLKSDHLSVGYSSASPLINDISVNVHKGEFISLIGRNGQGKTSFIRTIGGMISPLSGSIEFDGKQASQINNKERAAYLSFVLTERPAVGNILVEDLISYGRYPFTNWFGTQNAADKLIVEEAIALCAVDHLLQKKWYKLSDGERQKVMIARAIAQNTPLIILDEPTAHLDISNRVEVFELLRELCKTKGVAVVCSTHELQLALKYSSKLWLIHNRTLESDEVTAFKQDDRIASAFGFNRSELGF